MIVSVSIVTRTIGRPEFLDRCYRSLLAAAPEDAEWIIVDDAPQQLALEPSKVAGYQTGAPFPVRYVRSGDGVDGERVVGRTASANLGLGLARGMYFHLHDDDDACLPDFYSTTMAWLKSHPEHVAVCTHVERITEERGQDGGWRKVGSTLHNPHLRKVSFASLATAFDIPPICLVVRTEAARKVAGFNQHFDIGEDYDFVLRILVEGDIGVVRSVLSCVYQRSNKNSEDNLRNSHRAEDLPEYDARMRNYYLRQDLKSGRMGIGWLLLFGEINSSARRTDLLLGALERLPFARLIRKGLRR